MVYRARDTRLDHLVAIKVLPPGLLADSAILQRFEQEARTTGGLNHPNIVSVFDLGTWEGSPYLVMELLEGETLRKKMGAGALPVRRAVELATGFAHGLAAAHAEGVVHRDLKPENLFITRDGRVKILDFGLATFRKDLPDREAPTRRFESLEGTVVGTVGYMAPEQIQGLPVDGRADLFSLGVVLWEMLAGRQPFQGASIIETMHAILKQDPPELEPGLKVPPVLERVLQACLAKDPAARFHSAHDLAFALETLAGQERAPVPPPARRCLARQAATAVATLAIAAGLGGLACWGGLLVPGGGGSRIAFHQVTFRRGNVLGARFTADGQNIVYSAVWDGQPSEMFTCKADGTASRPLGQPGATIQAVNQQGQMLIITKPETWTATTSGWGTLALAGGDGSSPREILERVVAADFGPDGKAIAAIHQPSPEAPFRLEYPLGTPLLEGAALTLMAVRVAPKGDRLAVAFRDRDESILAVLDRSGRRQDLFSTRKHMDTFLAWSADGRRIYFQDGRAGGILTVDLAGKVRRLQVDLASGGVHDVSSRGQLLVERELGRSEALLTRNGREINLSIGDATHLADLSRDGASALLTDFSWGRERGPQVFLRPSDGGPPKSLGPGFAVALSPDARWALVWGPNKEDGLRKVPTGAGRELKLRQEEGWDFMYGEFPDDTGRVVAWAGDAQGRARVVEFQADGSPGKALALPSVHALIGFSPGWKEVMALDETGRPSFWPMDGGAPLRPPWTLKLEEFVAGSDGRNLLATLTLDPRQIRVDRLDLRSGERTPLTLLAPRDPVGFIRFDGVNVSRDGRTVGYSCYRVLESNLFVTEGKAQ